MTNPVIESLQGPSETDVVRANSPSHERVGTRLYEQVLGLPSSVDTRTNSLIGKTRLAFGVATMALILAACSPDVPGVGGNKPIQFSGNPSSDATAEAVNRESAINEAKAKAEAAAKAEADAKAAAGASKTSTPETNELFHCKLLPDCSSGQPITRPGRGGEITAIRYIVEPNTQISSLFAANVATLSKDAEGNPNIILTPRDKTIPPLYIKGSLIDIVKDDKGEGVGEEVQIAKVGETGVIFVTWSDLNPATKKQISYQERLQLFEKFFSKQVMQKQPIEVPLKLSPGAAGGGFNIAEPKFEKNS